jgi:hypothetical protein
MPSGWSEKKLKSETHRDRELKEMGADELRRWAESEVAKAFDRESVRAIHAARLDDCLRSLLNRLHDLISMDGMNEEMRRRLAKTIIAHEEMQERATQPAPRRK